MNKKGGDVIVGVLDLFRKNKNDEQTKWDKMWELWAEEQAESPYAELMTYQSEIDNGGHDQYFFNMENTGDLQKQMKVLDAVLPEKLKDNLHDAYKAYLVISEKEDDEKAENIIEQCDDIFYENEDEVNDILERYADKF